MATLASDGIHWTAHDLLCRNGMWNYAIGGRGVGKTYDVKVRHIKRFLKTGRQFIYLRRYETEFADKQQLFNDVAQEFPNHDIMVEGMKVMIRPTPKGHRKEAWRVFCYLVALSTTISKKSIPYPDVDFIVFDEFIIDRGFIRYMPNEVKVFLEFYNTVDRFTDRVRVLFLANAVSIVNPYFIYFGIKPRHGQRFSSAMGNYHVCELIESEAYIEKVADTRFGKMIAGTEYFNYAIANKFTNDECAFIAKKTGDARFMFGVVFDGRKMGAWKDFGQNRYYISEKIPKDERPFVVTKKDQSPDMMMVDRASPLLKGIKRLYMMGGVYFESPLIMSAFFDLLEYLNLR